MVEETNAIGTTYLRLDLLWGQARDRPWKDFRRYWKTRVERFRRLPAERAAKQELAKAVTIQGEIWNGTVTARGEEGSQPTTMLLLPVLNQMIDITATRLMATNPPQLSSPCSPRGLW